MGGDKPDMGGLKERLDALERENRDLADRYAALREYLRVKTNRLLELMQCPNPLEEGFDDRTILELDPIGTIADSFSQVLDRQRDMNEELRTEIDDRRKAEEMLREKEELFRTVSEFSIDWVFWREKSGRMIYVAPACRQISGYSPEDFYREPDLFYRVVHPDDRDAWISHCRDTGEQGIPGDLTFRILAKDGETRWISHKCRPVLNEKGEYMGIRGSNRDITADKKLEEEVLTARKMEAVGVLAGEIAHEFNNKLTVILGNISLLKQVVPDNHAWQGRLQEAEKASLRARDLANRLITFSGGGAPIRDVVSIVRVVEDVCRNATLNAGVRCEVVVPGELPSANVDEAQIRQVLEVLISNASESMPDGGVVLVRAGSGAGTEGAQGKSMGRYVEIVVEDQGVGIEERNLPKVFDPFFTTKKKKSGLGLPTAYSIIRQHGGHISVKSVVGKGTVFTVRLPAFQAPGRAADRPGRGAQEVERRRILVMDDDPMLRAVILDILDVIGYQGTAVADGLEAVDEYRVAKASGRPYDAVIMDLIVPDGMGGVDAIGKILEVDPLARVIVSSGYSSDPVMSEFKRYGFMGVITKPYRIQDLREILKKVIYDTPAPSA